MNSTTMNLLLGGCKMIHIPCYNVEKKIYEGKKTVIYSGIRLSDGIPVLLKLLYAEYPNLYDVEKLKAEYKLSKKIHSNNVVKIYSIENYEKTPVLILEDFGGESLHKILNTFKKFNLMDFLEIAIKLSQALIDIYNSNIIHKAINPNNIIINIENGIVKLTDFGSASLFSKEIDFENTMTNLKNW